MYQTDSHLFLASPSFEALLIVWCELGLTFFILQIAHYRHKGYFVPTYESCSTAAFKHGRTETIRSASNATVACAESFDPARNASVEEMLEKIKAATDWHTKLTKEAAMGMYNGDVTCVCVLFLFLFYFICFVLLVFFCFLFYFF